MANTTGLTAYKTNGADLYYSTEIKRDLGLNSQSDLAFAVGFTLDNFLKNPTYEKIINLHAKKTNLGGMAILHAHGGDESNTWVYYTDEGQSAPVQRWINRLDGKYATLILQCCNPGAHAISSKKSAVLAFNSIYSAQNQENGDGQLELFIPGFGYLDSYTLEDTVKKLHESSTVHAPT